MVMRRCAVLVVGLILLAACGQRPSASQAGGNMPTASADRESSTPTPGRTTEPTPRPSISPQQPGPAEATAKGEIRLEGRFTDGVENCIVLLTDDGKTYEITGGDPRLHATGQRVVVRGVIRTDLASICMQGPIVQVIEMSKA